MSNLLRSELRRLFKSRWLWLCVFIEIALNLWLVLKEHEIALLYRPYSLMLWSMPDELMSEAGVFMVPAITGVFMVFFIGTEFQDKTLNNKLIYGTRRSTVYLCELAVCMLGTLLVYFSGIGVVFGAGLPLLGGLANPVREVVWRIVIGATATLGFTALYHAIFLYVGRLAISALFPLPLGIGLFYVASNIESALGRAQFDFYVLTEVEKLPSVVLQGKNPTYIGGFQRQMYQFFYDFLPSGQLLRCNSYRDPLPDRPWMFLLYTLLFVSLCGTVGYLLFRKKQLK